MSKKKKCIIAAVICVVLMAVIAVIIILKPFLALKSTLEILKNSKCELSVQYCIKGRYNEKDIDYGGKVNAKKDDGLVWFSGDVSGSNLEGYVDFDGNAMINIKPIVDDLLNILTEKTGLPVNMLSRYIENGYISTDTIKALGLGDDFPEISEIVDDVKNGNSIKDIDIKRIVNPKLDKNLTANIDTADYFKVEADNSRYTIYLGDGHRENDVSRLYVWVISESIDCEFAVEIKPDQDISLVMPEESAFILKIRKLLK